MSEADLTQLGIELSLQHMQQQHQQLLHYQQKQFHNNDSFQSFASSTGNAQAQGNSSISPMPSTVTRTSVPLANTKTPEHKTNV
jgi:transcription initiation factor TFIID subunit TAF12